MHQRRAFTLIEMAIVLAIVGLMLGFGIQAFESSTGLACYEKTERQMRVINEALQRFVATNNRLPKPAYMNHGANNPLFGREPASATAVDAAGYATEVPAGMVATTGVLLGQLPHVTLGLSQDYSADCWGSKFTYAVTNAMTSANAGNGYPATADGTLRIYSNTAAAGVLQSDKIAYVVVSHGMNKFGATPLSYNDIAASNCNGTPSTIIDKENCDTAAGGNINFWNSVRNTGADAGANYFDDLVIYNGKPTVPDAAMQLYCWGNNVYGQFGHGTTGGTTNAPITAVTLPGGVSGFTSVAAGGSGGHICAIGTNGRAYCWGQGGQRQLGNGGNSNSNIPVAVDLPVGVTSYTAVANGEYHSCGIGNNGRAYCWGYNAYGQCGNGLNTTCTVPTLVTLPGGVTSFTSIAAGANVTCAIGNNGRAYCWGYNYTDASNFGYLGDGTTSHSNVPVPVVLPGGVTSFTSISTGIIGYGGCAIGNNGRIYCWGPGDWGRLGNGVFPYASTSTPQEAVMPGGVTSFSQISAGGHSCAIGNNGRAYCWGHGDFGQLGHAEPSGNGSGSQSCYDDFLYYGVYPCRDTPTLATLPGGVTSYTSIATIDGGRSTCAIGNNKRVYCWGMSPSGWNLTPTIVALPAGRTTAEAITGGFQIACALMK